MTTHRKPMSQFKGLNLSQGDIGKDIIWATRMQNMVHSKRGGLELRRGVKKLTSQVTQSFVNNIVDFNDKDIATGITTKRRIVLDTSATNIKQLSDVTLSILNNAASAITVSLLYSSSTNYLFTITRTIAGIPTLIFSSTLPTSKTVATLVTEINAAALGITATASGDDTIIAQLLENASAVVIGTASTYVINGQSLSAINLSTTINSGTPPLPFAGWKAIRSAGTALQLRDLEVPSYTVMNSCLYVANKYDPLYKFDGVNFYKAGVPKGSIISDSAIGQYDTSVAGTIDAGNYVYLWTTEMNDAKGNYLEGAPVYGSVVAVPASKQVVLILNGMGSSPTIRSDSGYCVGEGYISAVSYVLSSTTLILPMAGHSLRAGDVICLSRRNGTTNPLYKMRLASVTTNTCTVDLTFPVTKRLIDGSETVIDLTTTSITFAQYDIASNGLVHNIYRTKANPGTVTDATLFYLVDMIPNCHNPVGGNYLISDNHADATLGAEFDPKDGIIVGLNATEGQPPRGKYVLAYKDRLYLASSPTDSNYLIASDILYGAEWFWADGRDQLDMATNKDDEIIGLAATDDVFYSFKSETIRVIDGLVGTEQQRIYTMDSSHGGVAHGAICNFQSNRLAFISPSGPYVTNGTSPVTYLDNGENRIRPLFLSDSPLDLRRCKLINDEINKRLYFYLAIKSNTNLPFSFNNSSISNLVVYDYEHNSWGTFSNILANQTINVIDGVLYTANGNLNSSDSATTNTIYKELNTNTLADYDDLYVSPIPQIQFNWDDLGEPGAYKNLLRVGLELTEITSSSLINSTYSWTVGFKQDWNDTTISKSSSLTLGSTTFDSLVKLGPLKVRSGCLILTGSASQTTKRAAFNNYIVELEDPYGLKLKK